MGTAEDHKYLGNHYFGQQDYQNAIREYTTAIVYPLIQIKNPTVATYFSNRSLSYLRLQDYSASCADARKALTLDSNLGD